MPITMATALLYLKEVIKDANQDDFEDAVGTVLLAKPLSVFCVQGSEKKKIGSSIGACVASDRVVASPI